ncbi:F-box/kelch-repeat protein At3g23880-like [Gastrolobium bilobum]|uniref:F-box/kelch-repeat protein At3g23880-like n=1 Tax=Gastrolobium bilobum TaxID=150636 RepID=UPI002AB2DEB6|nr:F-box/kelch-repeat protein At3g23880-like [Gastrolobium bilobum]XP_061355101.1 F-box/kelch-repeat protein At3g23880-like [Gastrolobium bilobum]XP_061355107.1 F-box/kelch-repeat protein At3g23880-like [Gastrolobium bilobum]
MKRRRVESNLHWNVIHEILLRLPVKSLVRFKCVCKSWHSLISDSHFAKSHYELSAAPSHKLLQITFSDYEARSFDVDASLQDDSFVVSLVPPLPKLVEYYAVIWGSCRGFVLIENKLDSMERPHLTEEYQNLYIWNPSTGFHRDLSYSEMGQECQNAESAERLLIGFGYDPSADDYLVVVLWPKHDSNLATRLVLFSLRTNSLKEIQGPHIPYYHIDNPSFLCNDAIHWLAYDENLLATVILAFDLMKKNFYEISLPDGDFTDDFNYDYLGTMGGCLCLSRLHDSKTMVWIMKEYKVQSSWTMLEIPRCLSAVCMAKGGELVALGFDEAEFMKFNDKGELLARCEYDSDGQSRFEVAAYTESLLSLPGNYDGSMEKPSTEADQKKEGLN